MSEENYPGVFSRVKAIIADSIIVIILMFSFGYLLTLFETVSDYVRIIGFVFIFILYEPVFISVFGGTLGHMIIGIRVKRESDEIKNINFPFAILRFIIKALLGWISLITVSFNEKGKAIHDLAVGSVVIYVKSDKK
jgi:uncharacterized RDD family membrane protein YckC